MSEPKVKSYKLTGNSLEIAKDFRDELFRLMREKDALDAEYTRRRQDIVQRLQDNNVSSANRLCTALGLKYEPESTVYACEISYIDDCGVAFFTPVSKPSEDEPVAAGVPKDFDLTTMTAAPGRKAN